MSIRISVAMSVYNGEKYVDEQIDSILTQLGKNDELIISVDPSVDKSRDIVEAYSKSDRRVKVYEGPGKGVISNFQNALSYTKGDYIFLSDQDDIWMDNKVEQCLDRLNKKRNIAVIHDCIIVDSYLNIVGNSLFSKRFSPSIFLNIIKNRYTGCCMAFKKELLKFALPFPSHLPMHDQWIGILAAKYGQVEFIDEALILYRRHEHTVTGRKKTSFATKIKWRINIISSFLNLVRKVRHGEY